MCLCVCERESERWEEMEGERQIGGQRKEEIKRERTRDQMYIDKKREGGREEEIKRNGAGERKKHRKSDIEIKR